MHLNGNDGTGLICSARPLPVHLKWKFLAINALYQLTVVQTSAVAKYIFSHCWDLFLFPVCINTKRKAGEIWFIRQSIKCVFIFSFRRIWAQTSRNCKSNCKQSKVIPSHLILNWLAMTFYVFSLICFSTFLISFIVSAAVPVYIAVLTPYCRYNEPVTRFGIPAMQNLDHVNITFSKCFMVCLKHVDWKPLICGNWVLRIFWAASIILSFNWHLSVSQSLSFSYSVIRLVDSKVQSIVSLLSKNFG